ncbi:MAG: thiolase family protein [Rhodocyclaceae bacterium]|jgi:acetyl-CoA acetyltransferase family protein|nr:thiolase family protein [Rhodocyclaceae bacterium]
MTSAFIPYGHYWSTPFAKWQGPLAHLNSIRLAAAVGRSFLDAHPQARAAIDLGILGITNLQHGSFYGLPWLTGMLGLEAIAGPTVQQACATSVRTLQMAAQEIGAGSAHCALVVCADRCSNGPIVYYPDPTAPGGSGHTEKWVLDNFAHDPHAGNAMVDTAENVAAHFGISAAEQAEVTLARYAQYQAALAGDRAFQRRYLVDVPITDAAFRRQTGTLSADDGIFPTTPEGLAKLKPVKANGTVTFGTQTHPADGNAGILVTTREQARELATDPAIEVELLAFGQARVARGHMPMAPAPAAMAALKEAGLKITDVDAVKTHNPFAVNDIAFARETGFPLAKMNNYGCSLIWGHPQGPTGLRSILELIEELALRGGGVGLFTGCAAGDSAMAAVLRVSGRQ